MSMTITIAKPTGGIQPVPPYHAELLAEMAEVCAGLIKLLELERTGVRGGQGFWTGSDPILDQTRRLVGLAAQHRAIITTGR